MARRLLLLRARRGQQLQQHYHRSTPQLSRPLQQPMQLLTAAAAPRHCHPQLLLLLHLQHAPAPSASPPLRPASPAASARRTRAPVGCTRRRLQHSSAKRNAQVSSRHSEVSLSMSRKPTNATASNRGEICPTPARTLDKCVVVVGVIDDIELPAGGLHRGVVQPAEHRRRDELVLRPRDEEHGVLEGGNEVHAPPVDLEEEALDVLQDRENLVHLRRQRQGR